jgi:hypothetical protein
MQHASHLIVVLEAGYCTLGLVSVYYEYMDLSEQNTKSPEERQSWPRVSLTL